MLVRAPAAMPVRAGPWGLALPSPAPPAPPELVSPHQCDPRGPQPGWWAIASSVNTESGGSGLLWGHIPFRTRWALWGCDQPCAIS